MTTPRTSEATGGSLRALLSGIVDYAGLFPPARLDMPQVAANYEKYLDSADAWMLGRLVVPAGRLDELERHARMPADGEPWQISALAAPAGDASLEADLERIAAFNGAHGADSAARATIGTIELRAAGAEAVEEALDEIPDELFPFFEIPVAGDPRGAVAALSGSDAGAKVRTGGPDAASYPGPEDLGRFIATCASAGVPFKATAGLHRALRHRSEAVGAEEYGFLNVFAAAALAYHERLEPGETARVLTETSLEVFEFGPDALRWRGRELSIEQLDEARLRFAISFGSCSFEEPIEDLRTMKLL